MANTKLNGWQQTSLDLFRVFAALFVLFGHSFSFYKIRFFGIAVYPLMQNTGVVIFFLLSGFLSAYSISTKDIDQYFFKDFLIHKLMRIYSEYIPGLIFILLIDLLSIKINKNNYAFYDTFNIRNLIGSLMMLQNMGPQSVLGKFFDVLGTGRPLWTLSLEWWFYMLFGLTYITIRKKERISIGKMLLFILILFMCVDYIIAGKGNGLGFVFLLGVLCYYFYDLIDIRLARLLFPLSCLSYMIIGSLIKDAYNIYSYLLISIILSSALACLKFVGDCPKTKAGTESTAIYSKDSNSISQYNVTEKLKTEFSESLAGGGGDTKPAIRIQWLSSLSKSTFFLYLIHYSVIELIIRNTRWQNTPAKFISGIVVSITLALFFHYIFRQKNPFKLLLNKFLPANNKNR